MWGDECQGAFEKLKLMLSSSPVLSLSKEEDEFILDTDASNIGIGAVLSQNQEGRESLLRILVAYLIKPSIMRDSTGVVGDYGFY